MSYQEDYFCDGCDDSQCECSYEDDNVVTLMIYSHHDVWWFNENAVTEIRRIMDYHSIPSGASGDIVFPRLIRGKNNSNYHLQYQPDESYPLPFSLCISAGLYRRIMDYTDGSLIVNAKQPGITWIR